MAWHSGKPADNDLLSISVQHIRENFAELEPLLSSRIVDHNLDVSDPPNGHYVRYASGLQMAWVRSHNLGAQGDQSYQLTWTFPASFASVPTVIPAYRNAVARDMDVVPSHSSSTTSRLIQLVREDKYWTHADGFVGNFVYIDALAIGRWQ